LEYGRHKNVAQTSSEATPDQNDLHENLVASQSDENWKLNVKAVTNLISIQSGELQKAADQYTRLKGQVKFTFRFAFT
jgi:hypothetical protein